MRILVGIDTFGLIGGSERYAIETSKELALRGHEVGVICGSASEASLPGVRLIVEPSYSAGEADRSTLEKLDGAVLGFAPDVLFLLSTRGRPAIRRLTRLTSRVPPVPIVRFVQDHTLFCPGLNKMFADGGVCDEGLGTVCLKRYFFHGGCTGFRREAHRSPLQAFTGLWRWKRGIALARRASALMVASRYMRGELIKAGIEEARVALVPLFTRSASPALTVTAPDDATRAFVESPGAPLILAPTRLALPDKGVDYLITALGKLRAPFRAVIAGNGAAEPWLREKTASEGLAPRVHFAGWQPAGSIEWLYERSSIVVFPSIWDEPFGLVGIEAMAHSRPVVAFAVGGVVDWLADGQTGLLAPRRDTDAFARAVDRLLADAGLARRMGEAGRSRVEREFSPLRHVQALESLFEGLGA